MGPPIMEGTEASGGLRKLSDGTEVFPHGYQGERVVYRQSSWIKGTIAASAKTKVAPETEAIETALVASTSALLSCPQQGQSRMRPS
jgi:hypothetical protein